MSESIGELAAALAKAQGAMTNADKDRENPFFKSKYATLAAVWDAARKPLSDNGLAVSQITVKGEDGLTLLTLLMHASGQWIASEYPVNPVKNDPQSMGGALTYARRYALSAIIGQQADDDDDGNEASTPAKGKTEKPAQPQQRPVIVPKAQPAPTNGTTPLSPAEAIRKRLADQAAANTAPPTPPQLNAAKSALAVLTGTDNRADRHALTLYLLGTDEPEKWTAGQCSAVKEWIDYSKVDGQWLPSSRSVEEAKMILAEYQKDIAA